MENAKIKFIITNISVHIYKEWLILDEKINKNLCITLHKAEITLRKKWYNKAKLFTEERLLSEL